MKGEPPLGLLDYVAVAAAACWIALFLVAILLFWPWYFIAGYFSGGAFVLGVLGRHLRRAALHYYSGRNGDRRPPMQ